MIETRRPTCEKVRRADMLMDISYGELIQKPYYAFCVTSVPDQM